MTVYLYTIIGTAADAQTWEATGILECKPGDFASLPDEAMKAAFHQLTNGKAVYGKPGIGCRGPYRITRFVIEEQKQ
jgi:hypothetical protein